MSERHIVCAALAYARTLDTAMASGPDDLEHDALLRVGESSAVCPSMASVKT